MQALRPAFAARARLPRSSAVWHLDLVGAPPSARSFWLYWQLIARIRREGVAPTKQCGGIWTWWERRPRREASGFIGRLSPAFAAKACFPRACGRCSEGWMALGATHHQATNQRDEHTEHP